MSFPSLVGDPSRTNKKRSIPVDHLNFVGRYSLLEKTLAKGKESADQR